MNMRNRIILISFGGLLIAFLIGWYKTSSIFCNQNDLRVLLHEAKDLNSITLNNLYSGSASNRLNRELQLTDRQLLNEFFDLMRENTASKPNHPASDWSLAVWMYFEDAPFVDFALLSTSNCGCQLVFELNCFGPRTHARNDKRCAFVSEIIDSLAGG